MNQNWIVENLNNAFSTWNGKLTELWGLVTTSPQTFKGGAVWGVMQSLHNALIGMRVMANCYMDSSAATWVYFDEIHVLLKDSMSADFLNSTWKRFRKYNAYATGITQDIQDYLANPIANALLSNSEFVIMLRQTKSLDIALTEMTITKKSVTDLFVNIFFCSSITFSFFHNSDLSHCPSAR